MKPIHAPLLLSLIAACVSPAEGPSAEAAPQAKAAPAAEAKPAVTPEAKAAPAPDTKAAPAPDAKAAPAAEAHAAPAPGAPPAPAAEAPAAKPGEVAKPAESPAAPAAEAKPIQAPAGQGDQPAAPPAPANPGAVMGPQMPAPAPLPVERVAAPASKVDVLQLSGSNLGGPITVYGKVISEDDIRRLLCFNVGSKQVDSLKFEVLVHQEIERRKANGGDVSALTVSEAELDKTIDSMRKDFLLKYPTLDFATEVGRAFLHVDVYRNELRRTLLFDKVFFPADPRLWPSVTTEAIVAATGDRAFIDDAIESYDSRKRLQEEQQLSELPPDDPIMVDALRSWLLEALNVFATIERLPARLPADAVTVVEGVTIRRDDVWKTIQPYVTWDQVEEARRFLAQTAAAEHQLALQGALMTQEEFEANFSPNAPFAEAAAQYEQIAVALQGFPSFQASMHYERLARSHRKLIADELASDSAMSAFLPRANLIAGAAKADVEVILASAYDFGRARWAVDGWARAEAKAKAVKAKLDAGASWAETIDTQSEFWDPPLPEVGHKPSFALLDKGRFGLQTRNQLAQDLLESDYSTFLRGASIADDAFFDQPVATISDVKRGPRGYYIVRVNSRTPAQSALNLRQPTSRDFLINFISLARFGAFARQSLADGLAKGDIAGF